MSNPAKLTQPPRNLPSKKRKYDQLDPSPPPLPPTSSILYVALYALPPPKRHGGVLDYRWAFLLASDHKPETRGRQYTIGEASPEVDPRHGPGSSKGLGIWGRGPEELGLEQSRRQFDRILASPRSGDGNLSHKSSAWELEIQDVCMQSSSEARVRIQLPRVHDVESFEALIQDALLESDGTRGADWNPVRWMGDAWTALVEAGDVLGVGGLESEPVGWETVQKTAMEFVEAQESKGRFEERNLTHWVPTWGLLERQLLVS